MNEKYLAALMAQLFTEAQVAGAVPGINVDEQGLIFARDLISMSNDVYMEEMPAPVALTMFQQEPGINEGLSGRVIACTPRRAWLKSWRHSVQICR
jgi:hypothetical protein